MEYLIGVGLAVVVCAFAMVTGFDRDPVFCPAALTIDWRPPGEIRKTIATHIPCWPEGLVAEPVG